MSTTITGHDIDAFAIAPVGMASARCLIHKTDTREQWSTMSQAARDFVCDEGRNLRFITEFHGDDIDVIPVMCDLSGLARTIRSEKLAMAYGQWPGETFAWQWHPGGRAEPLVIALADSTPFNEDDYGTQTWRVTREDGRVIVEVPVRIDGRA
jgi:hypothetical protein